jgi:hypothetical protein
MNYQKHIIKKQIIEIKLSSEKDSFMLQNRVSKIYRERIIPLINDLFNNLVIAKKIYCLDKIEIDLGDIYINNLEKDLIDKTIIEIKKK